MLVIGEDGTRKIGETLAQIAIPGDCIALRGDLGAGKTLLAEAFIQSLHSGDIAVISPTFNLLQTYDVQLLGEAATLWHYDLYRLEDEAELAEIGLEEAFEEGICLIEWPEIAEFYLPEHCIHVAIDFAENPDNRNITIRSSAVNLPRLERAGLC